MKSKNLSDQEPIHIEVSLPNTLTSCQISALEELSKPYGGVVVSDEKITFPNLPQDDGSSGIDLCYLATELVERAKNTNSHSLQDETSQNTDAIPQGETTEYSGLKRPDCRGSSTIVPQQ